jgi:hypothetical protein
MTSPLGLRIGMGGMSQEEHEAFDYLLDKIKAAKPSLNSSEAIDEGIDNGMFLLGNEGELQVNKDYFNGKNV